jgi:hypothetical protein
MLFLARAFRNAIVLFLLAAPSMCPAHPLKVLFRDDFTDSQAFSSRWLETLNGGNVEFTNSGLSIKRSSNGLPLIQSKNNPFPTYDWSISFGYRFSQIGHYGSSIGAARPD